PGAPEYQKYLIRQAKRLVRYIPSSSGICIDRLDWLQLFNSHADDGIAWFEGAPARSLYNSWKDAMGKIGPWVHKKGKAIFVNPVSASRLDIMRHVDGIYDEHNDRGAALNASIFLGMFKPIITWTSDENSLLPDPDFYFQRFLYLGAFPTAPFPDNNHSIRPGRFADSCYLSYGALFEALAGRRWFLTPDVVRVQDNIAKVNIFQVDGAFIIPVMLAPKERKDAIVTLDIDKVKIQIAGEVEVLLPGQNEVVSIKGNKVDKNKLLLKIPLKQGCALIRIRTA
ncbi:MAG TPA: hypothetical protein PKX05_05870, partial [bacterium]|nr:hypothetical protein [bacterium]